MEFISKDQIKQLENIVQQMEDWVKCEPVDLLGYQEYHQNYYDKFLPVSGNTRLKKISDSIHNQVARFSYQFLQNREHLRASMRYHRRIMNVFKQIDKPRAGKLMKAHVLKAVDVLREMKDLKK